MERLTEWKDDKKLLAKTKFSGDFGSANILIALAREVASRKFDDRVHCISCAEEHEQLAEWLEELKAIKDGSIPIIHGKAELELHDKVIRKETIGDMVGNLIANSRTEIIDGKLMLIVTEERIKTVANEMKRQLDS